MPYYYFKFTEISQEIAFCNVINPIYAFIFNSGKEKNTTDSENLTNKRFYGPATSCKQLLKIGYTRNGFYLVKDNATSSKSHVEIVDCLFKNPNGVKEGKKLVKLHSKLATKFVLVISQGEAIWTRPS